MGACEKCVGGCLKGKGVEGVGGGNRGSFYVQRCTLELVLWYIRLFQNFGSRSVSCDFERKNLL